MEKEVLIKLIGGGLSTRAIGNELNIGQSTVRYWLKKYELKTKKEEKNRITKCKQCGVTISRRNKKFCSNTCQNKYQSSKIVEDWLSGKISGAIRGGSHELRQPIRNYLLECANYSCEECGDNRVNPYSGKSIMNVDHVDGDASNNHIDNLKVLCPSCHAMTPTYGNIGSRRSSRSIRYHT